MVLDGGSEFFGIFFMSFLSALLVWGGVLGRGESCVGGGVMLCFGGSICTT